MSFSKKFLLALIFACATFPLLAQTTGGVSTRIEFGPTLPSDAPEWSVYTLSDGSGLYQCQNSPTCTSSGQWINISSVVSGVSATPSSTQNIAQPAGTSFNANVLNYTAVVPSPALSVTTGGANWRQSPSGTISAGSNTVTLSPEPPGLMTPTQETYNHAWTKVWIAGTGTAEAVLLTGSTCPDQGGSGSCTITFTAANSHSAGFTIGSGSGGLQETINAAQRCYLTYNCAQHVAFGKIYIPPGDYTILARVTIDNANSYSSLDWTGTTVTCNLSDTCIFVGDPSATNQSLDTSFYNFTCRPAIVNGNYPCIEDHSNGMRVYGLYAFTPAGGGGATGKASFSSLFQNDVDENNDLEGIDTDFAGIWSHCSTDFCSSAVYIKTAAPAPLSFIRNSNINMQCVGNGIDNQGTNTLSVTDTQIQAYQQFGVRTVGNFDTVINGVFSNDYFEIGSCAPNPLGTGTAGLVAQVGGILWNGSVEPQGAFPIYLNTGSTRFNYYMVAKSASTRGSFPQIIGVALTNGTGTPTVKWPEIGTGPPTYDIIRTSGSTPFAPYTAICGGGSTTACGSVATGLTQSASCSNDVCSFTDDVTANTTSYTFPALPYYPLIAGTGNPTAGGIPPLPGGFVLSGNENAQANSQTFATLESPNIPSLGGGSVTSVAGPTFPTVFVSLCQTGSLWAQVWIVCDSGSLASQASEVIYSPSIAGTKGQKIFTSGPTFGSITNGHIITLVDSNPIKTLSDPTQTLYRGTPWDANDTFIALDNASSGAFSTAQLAFGAPVSISNYVGSNPDNTSWLERLTSTAKTFAVPVDVTPVAFSALPSCASGIEGTFRAVSDSTTNTWGATITGSGSDHVLGYCDGTNWTVAAK